MTENNDFMKNPDVEEFDIGHEEQDTNIDWSAYDGYEFKEGEIFIEEYPPQLADWCNERQKPNEVHYIEEIDPDEEGKRRFKYTIKKISEEEIAAQRKDSFERAFFNSSLGYIRRKVNMATGETKDFLCDLLPAISTGITLGQQIPIITYNQPDFSNDLTLEYLESLQVVKYATKEFCTECALQISTDFTGTPLTLNL